MDNVYELKMQLICSNIEYTLKNKTRELSPTTRVYIKRFIDLLDRLILSIDSLEIDKQASPPGSSKAFYFTPNLIEVLEIADFNKSDLDKEKLASLKKYLNNKKKQAEALLNNPEYFYKYESSTLELMEFIKNISYIYKKEYHVLTHLSSVT